MYKLYLDDIRNPEQSFKNFGLSVYQEPWIIVRNYRAFVSMILGAGLPKLISFDHDLALEHSRFFFDQGGWENPPDPAEVQFIEKTGYDCAKWLVEYCLDMGKPLPAYLIHSANPVGSENIRGLLEGFRRFQETK